MAVAGRWTISASKGSAAGSAIDVEVPLNGIRTVADIKLRKEPVGGFADAAVLQRLMDDINAALAAEQFQLAIAKLSDATARIPRCVTCYARLGDAYFRTHEHDKAEAAYRQALTLDDASADAWEGLAVLYNRQQKFDLAGGATARALALHGSTGPVDATSAYNSGVILLNQSRMRDAGALFLRAIELDPKMADAHFQLAATMLAQANYVSARTSLERYLALAPLGSNASAARALIDELAKMK